MFTFSQEYHFDYYIKYKDEIIRNNESHKLEFEYIINSQNHDYEIRFPREPDIKLCAKIIDLKNNIEHYFDLKNSELPLKSENFIYIYSRKIQDTKKQFVEEYKRRFFTAEIKDNKNNSDQYIIKEFKKEKGQNAKAVADVIFVKFKDDLSFVGLSLLFDANGINKKLKFPENYILKSGEIKFKDAEMKLSLEAIESQNFDLKIDSKQLIIKN